LVNRMLRSIRSVKWNAALSPVSTMQEIGPRSWTEKRLTNQKMLQSIC